MKNIKKTIIITLLSCLCLACIVLFTGCSLLEFNKKDTKKYTLTFVQEGAEDLVLQFESGKTVTGVSAPIQPQDESLVTEWNMSDDYVAKSDETITTTTYTKGLEFEEYYESEKACKVTDYKGTASKVVVPAMYKGLSVTKLNGKSAREKGAFEGNEVVTHVTLPEGLLIVAYCSFYNANQLVSVNLPTTLIEIGNYAFTGTNVAKEGGVIKIPNGVKSIGQRTFFGCGAHTVILPDGFLSLGDHAFGGASSLKNVVMPLSLNSIDGIAFWRQPIENIFYMGDEYNFEDLLENVKTNSESGDNFRDYVENGGDRRANGQSVFMKPTVYYYSEEEPTEEGDFWRYVDGVPSPW